LEGHFVISLLSFTSWGPGRDGTVRPDVAAPPPVEAYGKQPATEQISLSPSGQRYAFVAVVGERRRLIAMTADGKLAQLATRDLDRVDLDPGAVDIVAHRSDQSQDWLVRPGGRVIARTPYNQTCDAWKVKRAASGGRILTCEKAAIAAVGRLSRGRHRRGRATAAGRGELPGVQTLGRAWGGHRADATVDQPVIDLVSRRWVGPTIWDDQQRGRSSTPWPTRGHAAR
jgi:hypothetical protein